jgi:1-acyl-sn-glycerol-3-phosphate acyltransferase
MTKGSGTGILAFVVLVCFAGGLLFWIVRSIRSGPYNVMQTIIVFINILLTRVLWRVQVQGQIPEVGKKGGILICNHRSSVDPFFIQLVAVRTVHWFVAREYFKVPVVGGFLRTSESISTNRAGIDTASTKTAIRFARLGHWIGMLPEGRINRTDQLLLPGRSGAAMIALKAQVPVIPCYLKGVPYDGTFWGCLFMPARVQLVIGEPIDLSPYYDRAKDRQVLGDLTRMFLQRIAELAGEPDFEPQLAGRRWLLADDDQQAE